MKLATTAFLTLMRPVGTVLDSDPDAVDKLRRGLIDLQVDIATVCPEARYERANDPIIYRVISLYQRMARLWNERNMLLSAVTSVIRILETNPDDGRYALQVLNQELQEYRQRVGEIMDHNNEQMEALRARSRK